MTVVIVAILVLLGWKVAGWIGVDLWLLPALGTPWELSSAVAALKPQRQEGVRRLEPRHESA